MPELNVAGQHPWEGREAKSAARRCGDATGAGGDTIYVFASKAGAPTHPDWYLNLVAAGAGEVEVGTERYPVTVVELTGEERDLVYAEQARRYQGFAEYEKKTAGVRTVPVLALTRLP